MQAWIDINSSKVERAMWSELLNKLHGRQS